MIALSENDLGVLRALSQSGVRFMIVGQSAAVLQGSRGTTEDIDIWFERLDDQRIASALEDAGAIWISGSFGMRPPQIGGPGISDVFDVVTHCQGLASFAEEYDNAPKVYLSEEIEVRVLPLERILVSKRAAGRPKDLAQIPALETALAVSRFRQEQQDRD